MSGRFIVNIFVLFEQKCSDCFALNSSLIRRIVSCRPIGLREGFTSLIASGNILTKSDIIVLTVVQ